MDYAKYYKDASKLADEIRTEATGHTPKIRPSGLMQRPKPRPSGKAESIHRMTVDYLTQMRELPPEPEAPAELSMEYTSAPRPVRGSVGAAREALASIESSGNYDAIGPVVTKGAYKGQRAYGKYQVMEGNIGPWTKAALGKAMTKEEFLADRGAQDAVVEWQLQKSYDKHGSWEDAASVWFSGSPVAKAGNRSDGYTTVPEYVSKFQSAFVEPEEELPLGIMKRR